MSTRDYQHLEFKRKMGGPERRFLRLPNANLVMGARIQGEVTQDLLQSAVLKVTQKHPLLRVRIHLDDDATGWFGQKDVPDIPIEVKPRTTDEDWVAVAGQELKRAFPTAIGPLMRMLLLRSPDVSDLVITAHHSICDGRSLVYLIRDIMTCLAHPDEGSNLLPIMPIAPQDHLPASASVGWFKRFIIRRMNQKWLRKGISFSEKDYQDLHQAFWRQHHAAILRWELTPSQTAELTACCQREQVTVNSALYTAFLKAQRQIQGSSHDHFQTILVPVDFRDRLTKPVGEAVGFYASAVKFKLKINPALPFWEIARLFNQKARHQLTNKHIFDGQKISLLSPSFLDGLVFAKHGRLDDKMAVGQIKRIGLDQLFAGMTISNLGRLEIPVEYGDFHLDALIGPAVYSDGIEKVLEVVTIGGKMHFTMTFGETLLGTNTASQIKDAAMEYLAEAVI